MSKKLMCFVVVLCLAGAVFAAPMRYTDGGPDHNWNTSTNWNQWPNITTETTDHNSNGTLCQIVDPSLDWLTKAVMTGMYGAQNSVIQYTGSINTNNGWFNIGRGNNNGGDGLWQIYDGQIVTGSMQVPNQFNDAALLCKSRLLVAGGLVDINSNLTIGNGTFGAGSSGGGDGQVDVRSGKIISGGDDTVLYQGYIDNGWLIAYGGAPGAAIVMDYDVTTPGHTTIVASSGLSESPANGADGLDTSTSALTWTTPADPNFVGLKKYVYFGEVDDLNWSDLNDPNVEAGFLADRDNWIADAGLPLVESDDADNSTTVTLEADKDYYWQIDYGYSVDDANVVYSYLFTFDTQNTAPEVDAGNNLYSFLVSGSRTITLDGSFIRDDNNPAPATPIWTVISALEPYEDVAPGDPLAAIDPNDYGFVGDDNNQLDSQFEVLTAGTYILELDADDGEFTAQFPQQVTLFIRDTACKATQIYPGYGNEWEPGIYNPMPGDANEDCVVDLSDVAELSSDWLDEELISDTTEYIPEE
ncbi:MAG: hypothetical protein ISS71_06370 [Phycisphaerae bacterium]|nr:hypothetical protein [Phycisphaerae bacterium]